KRNLKEIGWTPLSGRPPGSGAVHDLCHKGIFAPRIRFPILGILGGQPLLESGISQAVLRLGLQVIAEQQALPERASHLTEVDVVRAARPKRRHPFYEELTVGGRVAFPMDIREALEGLDDRGTMMTVCTKHDIDDRFRGYAGDRGAPEMLNAEGNSGINTLPNRTVLVGELRNPMRVVRHNGNDVFRMVTPSAVFVLGNHATPP